MPLYLYEVIREDGSGGEQLEIFQKMSDPPLTHHPETGQPIRRVYAEPNAPRTWTDLHARAAVSDKNLASKGFTKYVKTDKGTYEKVVGEGPKQLKRDGAS
ncbi:MAG: FmdB family transcriptional regulator [Gemmataceae bacterium]|nr:FmdB family transcriptional regulator [Gemmataceae bacterium]MCS7270577.1 FmdB family transcriptional regulator [Gemmataceae bacterium]MDW8244039.1 FmdB family transcriptional regulator [Thermogemmata sp.]